MHKPETPARFEFEAWIKAPPYERAVERFDDSGGWPGNYRDINVELAWLSWQAASLVERVNWVSIVAALHHKWRQEYGEHTAYDAGRLTAFENIKDAIQAQDK